MKNALKNCFLFVFVAVSVSLPAQQKKTLSLDDAIADAARQLNTFIPSRDKTAVISFQAPTVELSSYLADKFTAVLGKTPGRTIVPRRNVLAEEKAAKIVVTEEVTDAQAVAIGKKLGAGSMVSGWVSKSGLNYTLEVEAINVSDSKVLRHAIYDIIKDATLEELLKNAEVSAPMAPAPPPAASAVEARETSAAAANIAAPAAAGFMKSKSDIVNEAAQDAAFLAFFAYVDQAFPNITVSPLSSEKTYHDKNKPYSVSFSWSHTDRIDVVNVMAAFYALLSEVSNDGAYMQALRDSWRGDIKNGQFDYYPTAYANAVQKLRFATFKSAWSFKTAGSYHHQLIWDLEFTLFDKNKTAIDLWRTTLSRSNPYGKSTASGEHTFRLSEEACQNLGAVRLTKCVLRQK